MTLTYPRAQRFGKQEEPRLERAVWGSLAWCALGARLVEVIDCALKLRSSGAPLVMSAKTMREEVSSHAPSSAPPSSSCLRFARIVFANRENAARQSGRLGRRQRDDSA
jgi:hypothetical protein